ncbi:MAG: sugar ABC transporter permease [Anaerolineae bacterium]|nr:sugar ABC transporter permease [Anaerolineae bacterium]
MRTHKLVPWMYILPASVLIAFFLLYPTARTFYLSFFDKRSQNYVGLDNYLFVLTSSTTRVAVRNNLLWMIAFPLWTVALGLLLAVLADKVRYEKLVKSIIFMPMAISFVGAGVVWKFVYAYRATEVSQTGLLNAIVVALGGEPVGWLLQRPLLNNLCLVFIGVWIWTGFSMTVFSAAYKNLPGEIMEAARIDGAGEWQLFWRITVPMLRPTIAVVTVTMMVFALKVFDIIYVTTNGLFDTEVMANRMYKEMFLYRNKGRASAIAILLFVTSVIILGTNVRRQRNAGEQP